MQSPQPDDQRTPVTAKYFPLLLRQVRHSLKYIYVPFSFFIFIFVINACFLGLNSQKQCSFDDYLSVIYNIFLTLPFCFCCKKFQLFTRYITAVSQFPCWVVSNGSFAAKTSIFQDSKPHLLLFNHY